MPLVFARSILGFAVVADTGVTWTDPDLSNASYDSVSFSFATQETNPQEIFFKDDGTKVYVIGVTNDKIFQYSLSTAWDLSTASYDSVSFSTATQENTPTGLFFKPDGSKFYLLGFQFKAVFQYSMSTAWDISTASYDSVSFSVNAEETNPRDVCFKPDGTKMYITGIAGDEINEYSLSTAWDVSTASYAANFSVASQEVNPNSLSFNPDGDKFWIVGSTSDSVFQYSLSTAWDISTASYNSISFSVASESASSASIRFKSDGSKMYILNNSDDSAYQYSTVASAWTNPDIANASYDSVSFSVASQDTSPFGITFKDDGTKFYIAGNATDTIYQYAVSTAWDLSTASFETGKTLSVSSEELTPHGVNFKSDGTSVYVIGLGTDAIYQYDLTTAWDISTGSYASKSLSVSTQETQPRALYFKDDGSKVYIVGSINDTVYQYALSTAWDISTGSFETGKSFSVNSQATFPTGLFFSPNGDKMYVLSSSVTYQYSLSTAWDVSTASYDSVSFSASSEDTGGSEIYFKPDGSKMYLMGASTDTVYQYST
jgi:6-phosphogluconolactonase (cycloisomerase 2 family)